MSSDRNLRKAQAAYRSGALDEAEALAADILKAAPRDENAWSLLADIANKRQQPAQAVAILKRALGLIPQSRELYRQLGNAFARTGDLAQAEIQLRHAMSLAPADKTLTADLARLLTQRGILLLRQGAFVNALPCLRDALNLGDKAARLPFAVCCSRLAFGELRPDLKDLLVSAIDEAWIRPAELVRAGANLLRLEPAFSEMLRHIDDLPATLLGLPALQEIARDPLLMALLKNAIVTDPEFEKFLTKTRRALLETPDALLLYRDFAIALASQCFINEYAFAESETEAKAVARLQERLNGSADENAAILLAAYRPLYRESRAAGYDWPGDLLQLATLQIREPLEELALADSIPRLTQVNDAISRDVQAQYEENPFPRWVEVPVRDEGQTIADWLKNHFPYLKHDDPRIERPQILVAGCGTGQEAAASARRFANAEVLAVDLSLRSLGYAERKRRSLGLANITYAQADVLELGALGRQFDIVECAGVLHHLADPMAGWRVLNNLMRPGGYMLMALYSERGRADLLTARQFAADGAYGNSAAELRRFRADILALPADHPARLAMLKRDDFYCLSMLRDLVFHVQEHRFTIPQIAAALRELGLEFCGFGLDPELRARFQAKFGAKADFLSLEAWDEFEAEYPTAFSAMYHFVLRKPRTPQPA